MNGPQINWYVQEPDNSLAPYDEYYAGSYRPDETLEIKMQVWNNRFGQEAVADAASAKVIIYFDNYEDSALLNLCTAKVNEEDFITPAIEVNKARVSLGILKGSANDGTSIASDNFREVTVKFGPLTNDMKNGLKNMFIDLEFESKEGGE